MEKPSARSSWFAAYGDRVRNFGIVLLFVLVPASSAGVAAWAYDQQHANWLFVSALVFAIGSGAAAIPLIFLTLSKTT